MATKKQSPVAHMATYTHKESKQEFSQLESTHRQEILTHLVWVASISKTYSWQAAKHYATSWPQLHGDLPERLIAAMKAKQ